MIDALFDFVVMIKDFVLSMIDGMATYISSLGFVVGLVGTGTSWMPVYLGQIAVVSVGLIFVLRIIGR